MKTEDVETARIAMLIVMRRRVDDGFSVGKIVAPVSDDDMEKLVAYQLRLKNL